MEDKKQNTFRQINKNKKFDRLWKYRLEQNWNVKKIIPLEKKCTRSNFGKRKIFIIQDGQKPFVFEVQWFCYNDFVLKRNIRIKIFCLFLILLSLLTSPDCTWRIKVKKSQTAAIYFIRNNLYKQNEIKYSIYSISR